MEYTITFCASGYIKQSVKITKKGLTIKKLLKLLNSGEAATSIHDGQLEMVKTGEKLGEILNTENNLEYEDFDDF